jgi:hypothetical protein
VGPVTQNSYHHKLPAAKQSGIFSCYNKSLGVVGVVDLFLYGTHLYEGGLISVVNI